jgi:hypothetical protein
MSRKFNYCPHVHEVLLAGKPRSEIDELIVDMSKLIEKECGEVLSGVDRQELAKLHSEGKKCIDGDAYFNRFHHGECEIDILLGVKDGERECILLADCKIQIKGGASIANRENLPDICENIYNKYQSARKNIAPIVPITSMYVIFNHAVAAQARNYLSRCSRGTNHKCRLVSCFHFECVTIKEFRCLVA